MGRRLESVVHGAAEAGLLPEEEEEEVDIELDDPKIDEAELPPLDMDDAEASGYEANHDDLLDRKWLDRAADEDVDEDVSSVDFIGLTIELNGPSADDDAAQVVDLDVGSLLTSLPGEETELDLVGGAESAQAGGEAALGVLRDMLLPDADEEESDDLEIGDDDRFPVFDDAADVTIRPGRGGADDERDREGPTDADDLT